MNLTLRQLVPEKEASQLGERTLPAKRVVQDCEPAAAVADPDAIAGGRRWGSATLPLVWPL